MKIERIREETIENIFYKTISTNGTIVEAKLPIEIGIITGLPENLEGIIVTSDLQGIVEKDNNEILLGISAAELLPILLQIEFDLKAKNIGVILCGDFYASLDKRGGLGDVRSVWNEFHKNFKWVVGIAGNHDTFGNEQEVLEFKNKPEIYYLDKEERKVDNIKIAGISGIIGKADRVNRIKEEEYILILKRLLKNKPDILILHQSPSNYIYNISGSDRIRETIEKEDSTLIFCGHHHWEKPLITLKNDSQVLNVDTRVVILLKE